MAKRTYIDVIRDVYPDAVEIEVTLIDDIPIDRQLWVIAEKYYRTPAKILYHEANRARKKLNVIISEKAKKDDEQTEQNNSSSAPGSSKPGEDTEATDH